MHVGKYRSPAMHIFMFLAKLWSIFTILSLNWTFKTISRSHFCLNVSYLYMNTHCDNVYFKDHCGTIETFQELYSMVYWQVFLNQSGHAFNYTDQRTKGQPISEINIFHICSELGYYQHTPETWGSVLGGVLIT